MPADLKSILQLEVPFIVVIASRDLPVREVMNLSPGAIIELPKLSNEELEILVNNKPVGMGMAVKVGENFGIRVTYVGDVRERISALGEETAGAKTAEILDQGKPVLAGAGVGAEASGPEV